MELVLIIMGILYLTGAVSGKVVAIFSIIGGTVWFIEEVFRGINKQKQVAGSNSTQIQIGKK